MIKKILFILLVLVSLTLNGCFYDYLMPSHPTKDKDQYWVDKRDCEVKLQSSNDEFHDIDERGVYMHELTAVRICLKNKGWRY